MHNVTIRRKFLRFRVNNNKNKKRINFKNLISHILTIR